MKEHTLWDCYNTILLSNDTERLRKLCARHAAFIKVDDVPGDIIEAGVFKGAGLMTWLKLLLIYSPGSTKKVIGFDSFNPDKFSKTMLPYEKKTASKFIDEAGDYDPDIIIQKIRSISAELNALSRVSLVQGDMEDTAPEYVKKHPGTRVSLLHIDVDTYSGTKAALGAFYPVMTPGGMVLLDEYGVEGWGESDAVDEYISSLRNNGEPVPTIKSVFGSAKPTAYFMKPIGSSRC
jgi:hypothetical protein